MALATNSFFLRRNIMFLKLTVVMRLIFGSIGVPLLCLMFQFPGSTCLIWLGDTLPALWLAKEITEKNFGSVTDFYNHEPKDKEE
jgi:hypothetical protein